VDITATQRLEFGSVIRLLMQTKARQFLRLATVPEQSECCCVPFRGRVVPI